MLKLLSFQLSLFQKFNLSSFMYENLLDSLG